MKLRWVILPFLPLVFLVASSYLNQINGRKYYMDPGSPERLQDMFRYTGDSVPFLSAHRGGPTINFPENCIETFENTLSYTYSLLEIDLIYSKDSVIMLNHDLTLDRTTTGNGQFSDYSMKELKELRLKDTNGKITPYRIPTFEEALEWGKGKTIFVVHRRMVCLLETIKIIEKFNAEAYAMIMSSFEDAELIHQHNPNIMMQVFMNSQERIREFEQKGVPWRNVMVFVTHETPDDPSLFDTINQRGALCIVGTHRNLDRKVIGGHVNIEELKDDYNSLYRIGVDIIETDIPVHVSRVVANRLSSETYRSRFLR